MKYRNASADAARRSFDARSSGRRMAAFLLAAVLLALTLLTACGGTGASAATMFLRKTEGAVAVADGDGADIVPAENLGLYSGYTVGTGAESYAWIDLDRVKLTKLDENSAAAIAKDGKNLSIDVTAGNLFFNVTEPLADDETMEIRTSSMLVGIRGTCGWAAQDAVGLLEGRVTVTAGDGSAVVNAGEIAVLTADGGLEVQALSAGDIPAFVAQEVGANDDLLRKVLEASGLQSLEADDAYEVQGTLELTENNTEFRGEEIWQDIVLEGEGKSLYCYETTIYGSIYVDSALLYMDASTVVKGDIHMIDGGVYLQGRSTLEGNVYMNEGDTSGHFSTDDDARVGKSIYMTGSHLRASIRDCTVEGVIDASAGGDQVIAHISRSTVNGQWYEQAVVRSEQTDYANPNGAAEFVGKTP